MTEEQVAEISRVTGTRWPELRRYLVSEGLLETPNLAPAPEPVVNAQVEGADAVVESDEEEDDA